MTQGLIAVVRDGHVQIKVIVGCDGMNVKKAAAAIRGMVDLRQIYDACLASGFGCERCLVVMNHQAHVGVQFSDAETARRYRDTFDKPRFNPRCPSGIVEYSQVI